MAAMTDWELLGRFAREGAQEAFAELVSRHLNFVYSSARRQVRSPQLVEEVTQSVFLELAHHATKLDARTPLTAWLYVVTRRIALNALRTELRRQAREHTAYELTAMNSAPSAWAQVEPLLEEALDDLSPLDRSAVLLRYFENKSLRDVGAALGTTEDTAQKRVSRALDQLRTLLAKRGVALTAAGLATDLSAHAIETAPAALGATISSVASSAGAVLAQQTVQTIAMTSLQKTGLAAALTFILGVGVYEARILQRESVPLGRQRTEVALLQKQSLELVVQRAALARQAVAVRDASRLSGAAPEAIAALDPATAAEMKAWLARVDRLKESFADDPQTWIPEMAYLTDNFWISATQDPQSLDPQNIRKTRSYLRREAASQFSFQTALSTYLKSHGDTPPTTMDALLPFFETPIDPAILDRYEIIPPEQWTSVEMEAPSYLGIRVSKYLIREKQVVDLELDTLKTISASFTSSFPALPAFARKAVASYRLSNGGQSPTDPAQLLPYLPQPVDPAKLQPFLK